MLVLYETSKQNSSPNLSIYYWIRKKPPCLEQKKHLLFLKACLKPCSKEISLSPEEEVVSWSLSPCLLSSADSDGPGQLEPAERCCLRRLLDLCDLNIFWSTNSLAPFFRRAHEVGVGGHYTECINRSNKCEVINIHTCKRKQSTPHGSVSMWISLFFLL